MLDRHDPIYYARLGLLIMLKEIGLSPDEISKYFIHVVEEILRNSSKKSAKEELEKLNEYEIDITDRLHKQWNVVEFVSKKKAFRDFSIVTLAKISKVPIPKIWQEIKDTIVELYKEESSLLISFSQIDHSIFKHLISHPELIHCFEWRSFEYLIAKILELFEYEIELTRPSKDGGVDVIAIRNEDTFGSHKYLIQAKKTRRIIRVEPVRELLFLGEHYKATKSCFITTSKFSKGAWELANIYRWKLELADFNTIKRWIIQANSSLPTSPSMKQTR